MPALLLALASPVFGAVLYRILHDRQGFTKAFDLAMHVAVPLLIAWHVFGHVVAHYGWELAVLFKMLALMILGIGLPRLIEYHFFYAKSKIQLLSVLTGFSGLAIHAILEGLSLRGEAFSITAPILLHRVMVGLMIWWVLFPRYGRFAAITGIAGLLAATCAGFFLGDFLPEHVLHGNSGEIFQAFVAGTLLHVIFHDSWQGGPHDHGAHNH